MKNLKAKAKKFYQKTFYQFIRKIKITNVRNYTYHLVIATSITKIYNDDVFYYHSDMNKAKYNFFDADDKMLFNVKETFESNFKNIVQGLKNYSFANDFKITFNKNIFLLRLGYNYEWIRIKECAGGLIGHLEYANKNNYPVTTEMPTKKQKQVKMFFSKKTGFHFEIWEAKTGIVKKSNYFECVKDCVKQIEVITNLSLSIRD